MGAKNSKVDIAPILSTNLKKNLFTTETKSITSSNNVNSNNVAGNLEVDPLSSVRLLMADCKGRNAFMEFLKAEHAEENLSFFEVSYLIYKQMIVNPF
jgi:hypothetical protein